MRVDLWLTADEPTGAHPDDNNNGGWPQGVDERDYEPAGPWEPFAENGANFMITWKRPYRLKKTDLERLSDVKQEGTVADILRAIADFWEQQE